MKYKREKQEKRREASFYMEAGKILDSLYVKKGTIKGESETGQDS